MTQGEFILLQGLEGLSQKQQAVVKGMAEPQPSWRQRDCASHFELRHALDHIEEVMGKGMTGAAVDLYQLGSESFFADKEGTRAADGRFVASMGRWWRSSAGRSLEERSSSAVGAAGARQMRAAFWRQ